MWIIQQIGRRGANRCSNLLLDNIAEKFPLKAALIFEDKTYTYTELLSHTQNLAAI
jgi:acyl-CoA synthetase (AMP-forming)/AMP-acid ligase II